MKIKVGTYISLNERLMISYKKYSFLHTLKIMSFNKRQFYTEKKCLNLYSQPWWWKFWTDEDGGAIAIFIILILHTVGFVLGMEFNSLSFDICLNWSYRAIRMDQMVAGHISILNWICNVIWIFAFKLCNSLTQHFIKIW